MIGAGAIKATAVKYSPAAVVGIAVFDWQMALVMFLGLVSGWALAAANFVGKPDGLRQAGVQVLGSILACGAGIIIVLWCIRLFELDLLGAATAAAVVGWMGVKGAEKFAGKALDRLFGALFDRTEDILAERRQQAQKDIAAHRIAAKESRNDPPQDDEGNAP